MATSHAEFQLLLPIALASVSAIDDTYPVLEKMQLPNDEQTKVAIALLHASIDQARSACFLLAHDAPQSSLGALILIRSQIDQLMSGAFFAGPATAEELQSYLQHQRLPQRDGKKLGPRSLCMINAEHFKWPADSTLHEVVNNFWVTFSSIAHGGRVLLHCYSHADDIGSQPDYVDLRNLLPNIVALTDIAISVALSLASNPQAENLQAILQHWHDARRLYFAKWRP